MRSKFEGSKEGGGGLLGMSERRRIFLRFRPTRHVNVSVDSDGDSDESISRLTPKSRGGFSWPWKRQSPSLKSRQRSGRRQLLGDLQPDEYVLRNCEEEKVTSVVARREYDVETMTEVGRDSFVRDSYTDFIIEHRKAVSKSGNFFSNSSRSILEGFTSFRN